jgi:hypothetical protein
MNAPRQRKTHDAGVVNDHDDDSERAEKIETGLAFAIGESWIERAVSAARFVGRRALRGGNDRLTNARS